jgi:hypothetical protein
VWQLEYSYDGEVIGDLFPITDNGFTGTISRNSVGQIEFKISLRKLKEFCDSKLFDTTRMFTPIKSTLKVLAQNGTVEVLGGWLSATPPFSFGSAADAQATFNFSTYLGLCAGAYLKPPYSYNDNFNDVATDVIEEVVERTFLAGSIWPISPGTSDVLPVVSDSLEAPKTLKDFLVERADNTTGTGTFDVYADPSGVITLYQKYGYDISADNTFVYPDDATKYGIKGLDFGAWSNFVSDMFLTGAGNGYNSTSGGEGAAIFATARNTDTIANTGYWEHAESQSDISDQTALNAKATSYVKDTDKPFSTPNLKIDGDKFNVYDHVQGGDLWLGDVVTVNTAGWVEDILPLVTPLQLRINDVAMSVDRLGHCDLALGMITDD